MKKNIWVIIIVVAVAALIGLRLAGNKQKINEKKKVTTTSNVLIPVNVTAARMDTITGNLVMTATLIPWQEASLAATTSGTLQSLNFSLGT
jgi:multidrug efflux pump subunit AcrA (membrane-fusion protein)